MMRTFFTHGVLCSLAALLAIPAAAQSLDESIAALKAYKFGDSRQALVLIEEVALDAEYDAAAKAKLEQDLIAVVQSDASVDAKRFAVRQLTAMGTAASVDTLAALIANDELADYAIWALKAIPDDAALQALLTAAQEGPQSQRANAINAIARRGDEKAVPDLVALMDSPDKAIAQAAIAALGSIGGAGCPPLMDALKAEEGAASSVLADACIQCGDALAASDKEAALAFYNALYAPSEQGHVRAAALDGLIRLQPEQAEELVVSAMEDADPALVLVASGFIRDLPGGEATETFAGMIADAPDRTKILLIEALAHRGAKGALDEISAAAESDNPAVQLAALSALGRLGDENTAGVLVKLAATSEGEVQRTARASLGTIPGKQVDVAILKIAQDATGPEQLEAISTLANRRAIRTTPALLELAASDNADVRAAALQSLRVLAGEDDMAALLDLLAAAPDDAQRKNVSQAIVELAGRIRQEKAKTAPIIQALRNADGEATQTALIGILGDIATDDALKVVREQLHADNPAITLAAVNALAGWPDGRPISDLKTIASTKENEAARAAAFAGYIRQLRASKTIDAASKLEAYKTADELATNEQEEKLVIAGLSEVPSLEALEYVEARQQDPAVAAEATQAVIRIAGGISGAYRDEVSRRMNAYIQQDTPEVVKKQAQNVLNGIQGLEDYLTAWQFAGPYFQEGKPASALFDMQFKAETDPAAATWSIMPMGLDRNRPWIISLARALGGVQRVAYLRTTITSESAQDVVLQLGTNDGCKVWWNGELIHELNVGRPLNPNQDRLPVTLKEGENSLVMAVYQHGGDWGATARLRTQDDQPVTGITQAAK